jgi:hypothetical protein
MRPVFLVAILLLTVQFATAQELEQLLIRAQSSSGLWSHLDGAVLMRGNQPVCAFGVRQIGEEKPQYTYFVLFRELPKSDADFSVTGPLRSKSRNTDYKIVVTVGKKSVEVAHKMEVDEATKQLKIDELRVAGEEIKANSPRVFVVDLTGDKPGVKPVDLKMPATVISPSGEQDRLGLIKKITAEYVAGSKELQELLK